MPLTRRGFLKTTAAAGLLAGGGPWLAGCASSRGAQGTTTLFTNGAIYVDASTKVSNLLIQNEAVAGIDVDPANHAAAEVVDLQGAALYPGFNDSHMHLMETGLFLLVGVPLFGKRNADEMVPPLQAKIATDPSIQVVLGAGFTFENYDAWSLADLAKIDAATGNRIIFLGDKLGHNAIVNTYTMQQLGITAQTPVPKGGTVIKEGDKLTGMFRESAMSLVGTRTWDRFSDADVKAGTEALAREWAGRGYTALVALMGATGIRLMRPEIFRELEREGRLPLRVNYCYTLFGLKDVDAAVAYMGQDTDRVRFVGGKIFVDGAFAGGQAWTSWEHEPPGGFGVPQIFTDDVGGGPELNLQRIVARAEELGMSMYYHSQGDRAIGAVLDALDRVVAAQGRLRATHTLIHLAYPTDALIGRILGFGGSVVTTMQPGFWPVEADTAQYYGVRAAQAYPLKKMIDSGVSVGMSTDYAVSPPAYASPTVVMRVAATGEPDPTVHQPVTVRDVVRGFTVGSSRTTGRTDVGLLHVGYRADMVIYDTDLYLVAPRDLSTGHPRVLSTWVSGQRAYAAPP
jgi:predicted amidohydrolase YtcJ